MMSTSFFSQSLCNSSAVMRRASSAGFFGCGLCTGVLGASGMKASWELQPVSTPTATMKLNDNRIATRIKISPEGSLPNSQLIYNFVEQMQSEIGGMSLPGSGVYRVPTLVEFFLSDKKPVVSYQRVAG